MRHQLPFVVGVLALAGVLVPQDPAQVLQERGERFASALRATGLTYEPSSSGKSYLVPFTHGDQRRTVQVAMTPDRVGGLFTHRVYTTVWSGAQPPDEATMRTLFTSNRKLGTYYLYVDSKGTWAIRFGATCDATDLAATTQAGDAQAQRLRELIEFVDLVGEESVRLLAR